ncbi:unnamed protein product, partial [Closterium sp. Naga37s-1]
SSHEANTSPTLSPFSPAFTHYSAKQSLPQFLPASFLSPCHASPRFPPMPQLCFPTCLPSASPLTPPC